MNTTPSKPDSVSIVNITPDAPSITSRVAGPAIEEARKRPELSAVSTTFRPTVPQVFADVDRDKVLKQGVEISDVYKVLQSFMGSGFINYFNKFGRQWQTYVQAEGDYRTNIENIGQFYVRNKNGDSVPLSALTSLEQRSGPEFTMRFNLFRSAQINATAAPGFSSAQAMKALEETFVQTMPKEMGYDYSGMSFQEKKAQKGVSPAVIFAFSFLCVFLILAAQYESWSLPFSVLLGTPVAVAGAFAGLLFGKFENNIYAQIGLVMLIGLAAKNAILIVEFAKMEHEAGKSLMESAMSAAKLRFRPILMTAATAIRGEGVPMYLRKKASVIRTVFSTSAGESSSSARRSRTATSCCSASCTTTRPTMPAAAAASTRATGVWTPSERLVWLWRSIGDGPGGTTGSAAPAGSWRDAPEARTERDAAPIKEPLRLRAIPAPGGRIHDDSLPHRRIPLRRFYVVWDPCGGSGLRRRRSPTARMESLWNFTMYSTASSALSVR